MCTCLALRCRHSSMNRCTRTCPYTCVHMESTLRMRMACSVACQALFASVVIHGCFFFDLGLVAFKIASCPKKTILARFPNPSKNSTFAVTPFVLTPLVRNQTQERCLCDLAVSGQPCFVNLRCEPALFIVVVPLFVTCHNAL
jgi:hypothetical protein